MMLRRRSLNSAGCEIGMNCETVKMARFLTTGRGCKSRGGRTLSGCGERLALERWFGKRLMRIVRMERDSTRVSGGVEVFSICPSNFGVSLAQALAAMRPSGGNSDVMVFNAKRG